MTTNTTVRLTREQAHALFIKQMENQAPLGKGVFRKFWGAFLPEMGKGCSVHYGKCEMQELLDQIYGVDSNGNKVDLLIEA